MIEIEIEIEIEIDRADSHVIDRSINDIDAKDRLKIVVEIRDNIEVIHTSEYHSFLQYLMPIFIHLLEKLTTPHFGDGTIALSHLHASKLRPADGVAWRYRTGAQATQHHSRDLQSDTAHGAAVGMGAAAAQARDATTAARERGERHHLSAHHH